MMAVNVTANWHFPARHARAAAEVGTPAARCSWSSGSAAHARAYRGLYATTKAALEVMARNLRRRNRDDSDQGDNRRPRPDPHADARGGRTRRRIRWTLPTPEQVAATIVPLCLPGFSESGKIWDYRAGKLLSFRAPG